MRMPVTPNAKRFEPARFQFDQISIKEWETTELFKFCSESSTQFSILTPLKR